jgi:hypothetical protein
MSSMGASGTAHREHRKITWLQHRMEAFFMEPLRKLVALEGEGTYVWLCAVNILCTAIEALSSFEFDLGKGKGMEEFSRFVEAHFPEFQASSLDLNEPVQRSIPAERAAGASL